MVMGPGQHVIKREDAGAEVKTPWQQTLRATLCNIIIYAALTACTLIIGKLSLVIFGALTAVVLIWLAWKWTRNTVGTGVVVVLSLSLLLVAGPSLAEMAWPGEQEWTADHWLIKAWMVGGLLFALVMPFLNGSHRYHSEVADPNGPTAPRAAIAWPGVIWPGQGQRIFEELNPTEEPQPETITHTTRVEIAEKGEGGNGQGQRFTYPIFNVDPIRMQRVAQSLASGKPFSEREMVKEGLLTGRTEYNNVRAEMLEMTLAKWRTPGVEKQGVKLTSKGRAVMRGLAES
jgi:hypothetical protein